MDNAQDGILHDLGGGGREFSARPVIMGRHGMVASGHYLASRIGLNILEQGGNAIDAAAAMGFALAVLEPHLNGLGGEVPLLLYAAKERRVRVVSGQGPAPRGASIDWFRSRGMDVIPGDGLAAAVVPSVVDTWITALARFGSLTLGRVLVDVIDLAEGGFPVYPGLHAAIGKHADRFRSEWPTSSSAFLPNDRVPRVGERFTQGELARTLRKLVEAEQREAGRGRGEALGAARDAFYRGELARRLARFVRENAFPDASGRRNRGVLDEEDLRGYASRVEEPVTVSYRGYDVYKCGPWTQGPVFLQQLNLLESRELALLGHNSPAYIHVLTEAAKLAFADREEWYGDPEFVAVPLERLLSKAYAAERVRLIDPDHASFDLRPGSAASSAPGDPDAASGHEGDTTQLDAMDRWGNLVSATPSGGWFAGSPVVEGLGFPLGTRLQMFSLDPRRANALAPGKRPRTTLSPSLVLKNGKPRLAFGTPGGDQQDQWSLQFFLNRVDFSMDLQAAADAPTFHTLHFPGSFFPHGAQPGSLVLEERIPIPTREALREKGHLVRTTGGWSNGRLLAIEYDAENGVLSGAASARMETGYALGW